MRVKKRVLVTGGAGFLGSHLCERLLSDGYHVVALDNFFTGSRDNLSHLAQRPDFELIEHDISFPFFIEVDAIYHLACPASPIHYQSNPIQTTKTSFLGTLYMLELATKLEVPLFQASTSEVYGDPLEHPQQESYWGHVNPIGPRACYDEGKRCAETLCFDFWRKFGTRIKIARLFNTYGPRMHPNDGRVVSNFIMQALQGEPITIYGDGRQTRSFCYVDDMIEAIVRLMQTDESVTGPINLGNPEELPIIELAEKILEMTGSQSELLLKPLPCDDPKVRRPSIALAEQTLQWRPRVVLEDGLRPTISYFSNFIDQQSALLGQ